MPNIVSKYKPLYTSEKRYFLLTGGRGSGKTYVIQDLLIRLLEQIGQGILYTRYTMVSVDQTIMPLFVAHIESIADINNYDVTKKLIRNKRTGSFILFSGIKASSGDQTGRLKSLPNITTWVIEEGEDFNDENSFRDIDDSIRVKGIQNRVIWIQNPTTREHFIFKKFFFDAENDVNTVEFRSIEGAGTYKDQEGKEKTFKYQHCTNKDVEHIHSTYYDNVKNLDAQKVKQWEEEKKSNPIKWENKYGGAWLERAEGTIFNNWEIGEFDESLPYIFGQDYGYDDPTTLVKVAIDKKNKLLYVQECFYLSSLDDDQIFELNYKHADNKLIIADSAAKTTIQTLRRKTTQERKSINLIPCVKKAGSVLTGIQKIQKYRIIVEKNSINLISELNNYIWLDKKSDTPIDNFNHLIDPLRYALDYLDR
jgi:phage terminase large subunit